MRWNDLQQENCSFARTLAVIGDRWTLLILRDCFLRVRRFEDFQERLGIGRGVLTERLKKLTDEDVLVKVPYQTNPPRHDYRLTQKGIDLYPVIMSIVHWGDLHTVGEKGRPVLHQHLTCGHTFDPELRCSECGELVEARSVRVLPGPGGDTPFPLPMPEPASAAGSVQARAVLDD